MMKWHFQDQTHNTVHEKIFIYKTLITHIQDSNNEDQFAKCEEKVEKSCKLLSKIQRVSTLPSKKHMQAFNTMMITRKS